MDFSKNKEKSEEKPKNEEGKIKITMTSEKCKKLTKSANLNI